MPLLPQDQINKEGNPGETRLPIIKIYVSENNGTLPDSARLLDKFTIKELNCYIRDLSRSTVFILLLIPGLISYPKILPVFLVF